MPRLLLAILAGAMALGARAGPLSWQPSIEIAAGGGEKGPWQQNESRYDYVDDPSVAISERGEISIVWVDQARKDVFFQRFEFTASGELARLRSPINLSRNPETFSWLPRIVASPRDPRRLYVLWQEIIFSGGSHGGDILFARSEDAGASFTAPLNLSNSVGGDGKGRINKDHWDNGSLDLAVAADGRLYAAWTEYDGALWFTRSADGGRTFEPARQLAGGVNEKPARAPAIAAGPGPAVHVAWTVGEEDGADIRVLSSADGGSNFNQKAVVVAHTRTYSDAPKLAVDPGGTVHLVYAESASGPFDRYHIRYTRSSDGAKTFQPAREISSPAPSSVTSSGFPALAIDGKGHLYVVWELFQNPRERPRGLGYVVSRDGGRSFTRPETVADSADPAGGGNGSFQGLLMQKLAVNRSGALAIVNSSLKENQRSRVWLIRGKPGD